MDTHVYEVVRCDGAGTTDSRLMYSSLSLIFWNELDAKNEANRLWLENTTEDDRTRSWCHIHYIVNRVKIQ